MNSLIMLSTLFFFNDCTDYAVLFHYYYTEISYFPFFFFGDYTLYVVLLQYY